jgi:hypothetical protein
MTGTAHGNAQEQDRGFVDMHSLVNARLAHKWLDLREKGIVETHAGH